MEDREVLLKCVRRYSKDETVKWLKQELCRVEFELGVVKSERDEAWHKLFTLTKSVTTASERKLLRSQYSKDEYVSNLKQENLRIRKKCRQLKIEVDRWREKYFDMVARKNLTIR